ncbi:hypothetical protein NBRC116583_09990 [Arenicella sp. 4NH20-0111]|uniref:SGNH/GDSL hydrolase family protein n=1 Tax=Arenicella sp. 4NH20-0111 TaxID=3127648 RepID=UPI003102E4E5
MLFYRTIKFSRVVPQPIAGLLATLFISLSTIATLGAQELPTSERSVVVLFGDSISVGFNADFRDKDAKGSTDRGCPTLYLTNLLLNQGDREAIEPCSTTLYDSPIFDANQRVRNAIVVNWGEGGTSTERGLERIESHLNRSRNDYEGNRYIALIMYGTNDRNANLSSTTTGFNVRDMIIKAKQRGFTPVVANLTPRDDQNVVPYNTEIESRTKAENTAFVNLYDRFVNHSGGFEELIDQENASITNEVIRLHPNDNGYLIIAETWFDEQLKGLIPTVAIAADNRIILTPVMSLLLDE